MLSQKVWRLGGSVLRHGIVKRVLVRLDLILLVMFK
jgi:hypothetical protein